jgi:hypothetical protein
MYESCAGAFIAEPEKIVYIKETCHSITFTHFLTMYENHCCRIVVVVVVVFTRVGKQMVNIPSFMVRVDSQKHIDFALTSPFGGGRSGRVKRKSQA